MRFVADFHIHSRYSLATSSQLAPETLDLWARKKGINVVGTGDAVHPKWLSELKEKLSPLDNGLFTLKKKFMHEQVKELKETDGVGFILTVELSCIYKRDGKTRKVHNIVVAPSFDAIDKMCKKLSMIGNIVSDGRPILGLDSQDLLDIVLSADEKAFIIPAHIWTPWFSVLGSKSGFDTVDECYGSLSKHIFAVETGLSSDPKMNRQCSFLDKYTLVSNSDAHSPENLGREANIFNTIVSYDAIVKSLKGLDNGFVGTIEYFPEEGKYHLDGHRKCAISWEPSVTEKHKGICPVCGKEVTFGVASRVHELADRKESDAPYKGKPFYSITPLKNILSEIYGVGHASKKIAAVYEKLISEKGSEFSILLDIPIGELEKTDPKLAAGIDNMRQGRVTLCSGYDGVFGTVKVF